MRVTQLVIDSNDLDGTPAFWAYLLDMKETARHPRWVDLEPLGDGGPVLSFQQVPEGKLVKNRLHLHVSVPDVAAAGRELVRLHATEASEILNSPTGPWQLWRDPEGNEFCVVTA